MVPDALTLVNVTVCGALVVDTVCGANVRLVGDSDTAVPIPWSVTICGLLVALSVMVTVAFRVLMLVGLNVTLMAQLELAARDVPQLLVWEKSFRFVPVTAMLVNVTTTVEDGFVTVMTWGVLEVATSCVVNARAVGETVSVVVVPTPVPVSAAD